MVAKSVFKHGIFISNMRVVSYNTQWNDKMCTWNGNRIWTSQTFIYRL